MKTADVHFRSRLPPATLMLARLQFSSKPYDGYDTTSASDETTRIPTAPAVSTRDALRLRPSLHGIRIFGARCAVIFLVSISSVPDSSGSFGCDGDAERFGWSSSPGTRMVLLQTISACRD